MAALHCLTPVWGETYVQCFVELSLPTLLSPGNLPAIQDTNSLYHIFTRSIDRPAIEAAPSFQRLADCIAVKITEVDEIVSRTDNRYLIQSDCYRLGIEEADRSNAAMIFLNADVVVADGGIRYLADKVASGVRSIEVLGIRLNKSPVSTRLLTLSSNGVISISPRELVRIAIENLHQITRTHLYHGEGEELMPAGLMWRVGNEGILARCFHLHPILVYPQVQNAPFGRSIDDDYVMSAIPDNKSLIIGDSDEFCACELSDDDRRMNTIPRGDSPDRSIAQWAYFNARPRHHELLRHVIRLHDGMRNPSLWKTVEAESNQVVDRVLTSLADPDSLGVFPPPEADSSSFPSDPFSQGAADLLQGKEAPPSKIRSLLSRMRQFIR